ncbi:MAG TPA: serine/threonine-protein kinase [Microlunatus sp.]|nr:serine/threonine-protein kinase [Microlunatus sp.]
MQVGPGLTLASRYRLERLLGRGGMGEVYEATDAVLGRQVAVKVFRSDSEVSTSQARQQLEIQALARLQHPNIVAVFDAGTDAGVSFVVMQLIDGTTLADRTRTAPMRVDETAQVGVSIADALADVHALGMVHRDIKPGNVLCATDGTVYLTDFGIVRLLDQTRLTQHGTVGTVSYLAPEQVRGKEVGPAADIYALGLVLLECLTGRLEYPGSSAESAVARLARPPRIPADLPDGWPELLTSMTADDPADRPPAAEVARRLHRLSTTPPLAQADNALPQTDKATAVRPKPLTQPVADDPSSLHTRPMTQTAEAVSGGSGSIPDVQRRHLGWFVAAGVIIGIVAMVTVFLWLGPGGGSSLAPGTSPPAASPGSDRLGQDLRDLQSAVQP